MFCARGTERVPFHDFSVSLCKFYDSVLFFVFSSIISSNMLTVLQRTISLDDITTYTKVQQIYVITVLVCCK